MYRFTISAGDEVFNIIASQMTNAIEMARQEWDRLYAPKTPYTIENETDRIYRESMRMKFGEYLHTCEKHEYITCVETKEPTP